MVNTDKCNIVPPYYVSHPNVAFAMQNSINPEVFEHPKLSKFDFLRQIRGKMKILSINRKFTKFQKSSSKRAQNRVPATAWVKG